MSEFSKGVINVLGDECPGDECRTILKLLGLGLKHTHIVGKCDIALLKCISSSSALNCSALYLAPGNPVHLQCINN